jgi:hypothetical protein
MLLLTLGMLAGIVRVLVRSQAPQVAPGPLV